MKDILIRFLVGAVILIVTTLAFWAAFTYPIAGGIVLFIMMSTFIGTVVLA